MDKRVATPTARESPPTVHALDDQSLRLLPVIMVCLELVFVEVTRTFYAVRLDPLSLAAFRTEHLLPTLTTPTCGDSGIDAGSPLNISDLTSQNKTQRFSSTRDHPPLSTAAHLNPCAILPQI